MRQFTNNEKVILDFLIANQGKWFTPTVISRKADKKEHSCAWASHICLRLNKYGILRHNSLGGYCYNKGTLLENEVVSKKILRPLEPIDTEIDLKCPNGDSYTISTLSNGLQIKKNGNNDENISISTRRGDRLMIEDNTVYIY